MQTAEYSAARVLCLFSVLLADRTSGRACAIASVVVCNACIVGKRCVLEQKLLLTDYRKSYEKSTGTKMNALCESVPLRWEEVIYGKVNHIASHSPLNISETVRNGHGLSK